VVVKIGSAHLFIQQSKKKVQEQSEQDRKENRRA